MATNKERLDRLEFEFPWVYDGLMRLAVEMGETRVQMQGIETLLKEVPNSLSGLCFSWEKSS